jgi:hypothetical protein
MREQSHDESACGWPGIRVFTSDRARCVGAKQRGSVGRQSEGGTA